MDSLRPQLVQTQNLNAIVGVSSAVIQMRKFAKRASATVKTVLLTGETGAGKDHLAKHIGHLRGEGDPFVQIDCGLFPPDLMESELFGHVMGAFTGANRPKFGLVEKANNGTLFLNEVGNLPISLQSKLLRFMEEKTYRKVGGTEDLRVNVRFIAGTNINLRQEVAHNRMRGDLYYRISTIEYAVPSLRERPEDISFLAQHFLVIEESERQFSPQALKLMTEYSWPGNIRELRSVIDKILFHSEVTGPITAEEVKPYLDNTPVVTKPEGGDKLVFPAVMPSFEELQREALMEALKRAKGNQGQAGTMLAITARTVGYHVRKWGLSEWARSLRFGN